MPTLRCAVRVTALIAVAASAGLFTGCSGNDATTVSGPIGTTPPLTKEALVSRSNEICTAADKAITEIADTAPINNTGGQQVIDDLKVVVDKITPVAQNAINELASLTPPAGDANLIRGGTAKMQAALDAAKADPSNQLNPIGLPDAELYNYGLSSCFTKPSR